MTLGELRDYVDFLKEAPDELEVVLAIPCEFIDRPDLGEGEFDAAAVEFLGIRSMGILGADEVGGFYDGYVSEEELDPEDGKVEWQIEVNPYWKQVRDKFPELGTERPDLVRTV